MKVQRDEWRLIALASIAFMLAAFITVNEPEGGDAALWYIYLILFWVGLAVFLKGNQGISKKWKDSIIWGSLLGGAFLFMHAWQPAIFRLGFPNTVESIRFWIVGVIAPIGEELAFRQGLYLMVLRQRLTFVWAALINSAIFAGFHWYAYGLGAASAAYLGAFSFGIIACWLTEKTDNALASTITHMIVNMFLLISPFVVVSV